MNVFYEELPDCVIVNGKKYPILTNFREWIRFSDMLQSDITPDIKIQFISEMFLKEIPNIYTEAGFKAAIDGITDFLIMREIEFPPAEGIDRSIQRRGIYYDYDAPYIISAFLREYRIDLLDIPYLHWWKFKLLLDGLDENSLIKERIYYRTVDIRDIKDKDEKNRILRIRKRITIPDEEYVMDGEIGNAFI